MSNRLLASLPPDDFARIQAHLKPTPVRVGQIFQRPNEPIEHVIFMRAGVASFTTVMRDGSIIETATIGREGMLGIDAFYGATLSNGESMLQVGDGEADLMPLQAFRDELARGGPFYDAVQRYSLALLTLVMQSAACLALHEVQERCARWLLMAHDRVDGDEFYLSHEFLASMLGSTRPTVSVAAGVLQRAGLISYRHGRITILDRPGLEAASCECYSTVRDNFARLSI